MPLSPGARLGPYEVIAVIGEGGMGAVYRAHDPRLGRDVAIKVLRGDVMADGDRRARFAQEAKAASALNHASIVTIHDIGTQDDVVYMVMELIDGRPLDQVVRPGGVSLPDVLRIGSQIADACAAAHARQIIHRDLKPANVMLQSDGRVKILDFGLAKFVEASDASRDATQTAAGMILGTAAYMSPEQAEGKSLDARTDIFSLGVLLYELSTGRRPFLGSSNASVLAEVLKHDPPSPDELRTELPPALAHLIMRCLRKDPERRVQSMADLRAALEELKDDVASGRVSGARSAPVTTTMASASAPAARSSRALLTAIGVIVVMIGVAGYFVWRASISPAVVDNTPLQPVPLTTYEGSERAGGFSPDGTQIAFAWNGESGDNVDIYIKLIGPGNPVRLTTDPAQDSIPRWSPDGRQIAFARLTNPNEMSLMVIPSLGGTERKIAQFYPFVAIASLYDVTWTPDSQFLFVAAGLKPGDKSNLHRVNLATGEIKTLITVEPSSDGYLGLDVSPDQRRIATVHDRLGSQEIQIFDLSKDWELSNPRTMKDFGANALEARWTPDSRDLLFTVSVNNPLPLYRLSPDAGTSVPLLWVGPGAATPIMSASAHRLVFTRDIRDTNIWRVALGSGSAQPVMDKIAVSSFREVAPVYSPDGKRLAFHSNRSGTVQIWVANADGSKPVQLTSMDPMATTGTPRWSPDGQRLVFDSNAAFDATTKGGYHLYIVNADGGQPRPLTTGPTRNFSSWWGPDNSSIYFTSDRSGRLEVWKIHPDGTGAQPVTTNGGDSPQVSPDGQWVYFTKRDGVNGLWRMPIAGGTETRVVESLYRYNYAVTTRGVYYAAVPAGFVGTSTRTARADRSSGVRYLDFSTNKTSNIAPIDGRVDLGLCVSPDGKYLLFTKIDYIGADLMVVEKFR